MVKNHGYIKFSEAQLSKPLALLVLLLIAFLPEIVAAALQSNPHQASRKQAMVATVNPLATQAGIAALERGGNAVDAAIAAALTLGVVDGYNSGIGGGCFILIRSPDGNIVALDAREMAPAAAHRDMFLREGKPDTNLSQVGPLASGVPGALAGYSEALKKLGRLSLSDVILPAAEIADNGFEVTESYAELVRVQAKYFQSFPGSRVVFLDNDGNPIPAGRLLVQRDLATTYRSIAQHGVEWFYQGPFAETTAQWMKANGGIMTAEDFANYRVVYRTPLRTSYREYEVIGFPPPSSGGVHVAQILNILEPYDLSAIHASDPTQFTHVVSEAMKLAFADRAFWLGDPDFAKVPRGLIDKTYGAELAGKIDLQRASRVESHGIPPLAESDFFEKHTTHIATADSEGYWVAITTTVNTTFGSKVIVPGLGVIMNNQMDDFAIAPGVPNAFGLVGNNANSVGPGKRPLSSMSPTLILRDGQPVMTVGAAGGPRIITQSLLAILRTVDLQLSPFEALKQPRFHHQWSPDKLYLEKGFDEDQVSRLKSMGHRVEMSAAAGISQAIWFDPQSLEFIGVADPRTGGTAFGR